MVVNTSITFVSLLDEGDENCWNINELHLSWCTGKISEILCFVIRGVCFALFVLFSDVLVFVM